VTVIVGNVACAVHAAAKLGSQAFGMFVKRQNQLHAEKLSEEEVLAFREAVSVWNPVLQKTYLFALY